MNAVDAVLLGVVQGLTEFLPISSSGHLVFAQYFLGITKSNLTFDIFIHFTTLFAILVYFKKDVLALRQKEIKLLLIGTIPAVIVGLLFRNIIELAFTSFTYVSLELIATGIINILIYRKLRQPQTEAGGELKDITSKQSFLVGIGQAIAISPGISRSGTTVLAGLMNGMSRETAFHFSFLLAIPAILGAVSLEVLSLLSDSKVYAEALQIPISSYLLGGVTAFIFGLLSLKIFEYVIQKAQLHYFGFYCIALGIVMYFITGK